jgi:hypothetical protein
MGRHHDASTTAVTARPDPSAAHGPLCSPGSEPSDTGSHIASVESATTTTTTNTTTTGIAAEESYGWFDEPDAVWQFRKRWCREQAEWRDHYPLKLRGKKVNMNVNGGEIFVKRANGGHQKLPLNDNNFLMQFNWRPLMECPEKVLLAGPGFEGKFLCGAARLSRQETCVTWSCVVIFSLSRPAGPFWACRPPHTYSQ